ncbi:MAG: FG-GAP-like repeat-containing protein [Planctomycetota bacterium]
MKVPSFELSIRALIVLGCLTAVSSGQTELWSFYGDTTRDSFGVSIAGIGDMNGDGVPDIAVGAPHDDDGGLDAGSVTIFSGKSGNPIRLFKGPVGSNFGAAVSAAGDIDGDGWADLLVGAPFAKINGVQLVGAAYVLSPSDGRTIYSWNGAAYLDAFGSSISSAGDADGDGVLDVAVGASSFFQNLRGYVRVFSGRDGSLIREHRGTTAGDFLGTGLASPGDLDGDGHDELLVGAPQTNVGRGYVKVFSGRTGLPLMTLTGLAVGDQFGHSVTGLGDLDGDQVRELAVGAYKSDLGGLDSGSVTVFSGASFATLRTLKGDAPHHWLGYAVADAGDVDADGISDLIAAAHGDNSQTVWTTYGRVYSGLDGRAVSTITVDLFSTDSIIQAVDGLGDLDGDGRDDYLVSDFWSDEKGPDFGAVWVISGCNAPAARYGPGCPGTGGEVPGLEFVGCPAPGAQTRLSIRNGLGGAPADLLVSLHGRANLGKANCRLHVMPPLFVIPVLLSGPSGVAGAGSFDLPIQIPPTVNLIGWRFNAQARVLDPGAYLGSTFTNGVEIVIQ